MSIEHLVLKPVESSVTITILKRIAASIALAALIALGAHIRIPFYPVPITFQTFFVLMGAAVCPLAVSTSAPLLYVLGGLVLPIFAQAGGPLAILGPTGGYLIGFAVAGLFGRLLFEKIQPKSVGGIFLLLALTNSIIYCFGVPQLWAVTHLKGMALLTSGLLLFIPGDLLKLMIATELTRKIGVNRL